MLMSIELLESVHCTEQELGGFHPSSLRVVNKLSLETFVKVP